MITLLFVSATVGTLGCGGNKELPPTGGGPPVASQDEIQKQIEMSMKKGGISPDSPGAKDLQKKAAGDGK